MPGFRFDERRFGCALLRLRYNEDLRVLHPTLDRLAIAATIALAIIDSLSTATIANRALGRGQACTERCAGSRFKPAKRHGPPPFECCLLDEEQRTARNAAKSGGATSRKLGNRPARMGRRLDQVRTRRVTVLRGDKPSITIFDRKGGKNSRSIRARVDSDPVELFVDVGRDRMAMNDDEAVVGLIEKEWLPNPSKVGLSLLFELDAGPDPGMDKQIIAEPAAIDKAAKEFDMGGRHNLLNEMQQFIVWPVAKLGNVDAVAFETLETAELEPARDQHFVAADNAQEHLLVITEEEKRSDTSAVIGPQTFYDLGGTGAAIDQVAKENEQRLAGRTALKLGMNLGQELLEQIEAAVNISDDVSAIAGSAGGSGLLSRREV